MRRIFLLLIMTCGSIIVGLSAYSQSLTPGIPDARMLRYPDVSKTQIVFVYAGDIWTVPREGGMAQRLSSPAGEEMYPRYSPDGNAIAFSGNYEGNTDVYVMSSKGGIPKRLTHHPGNDFVVEWYPDGRNILFRSGMTSPSNRFNRFFRQPLGGGIPEELPLAYGELASFSPDGNQLAFQFISNEHRTWKRYQGGTASEIWIYDFAGNTSYQVTDFKGTDALPMWHDNMIYFLSDRDENVKLNIWAYDVGTKAYHQVTFFTEYDVKWPSIGPDAIVFENAGRLHLLTLDDGYLHELSINVPADLPEIRKQRVDLAGYINEFAVSPAGKRAVFSARGEIVTVPEKNGSPRNLTNTPGIAERSPAWSPDGTYLAYFSDKSGEYNLYIRKSDGSGDEIKLTETTRDFYYNPVWSPDSKKIAYSDKAGKIFIITVENHATEYVDRDEWDEIRSYSWASDSRWLTYAESTPNGLRAIMVYDVSKKEVKAITSGFYNDLQPVFDPDGKYIYFYSNRTFEPLYSDMDWTWIYPNATNLYAVTLRKDVPSPLAPRSDEESIKEEKKGGESEAGSPADTLAEKKAAPESKTVDIDFEGIERRVVAIPVRLRNIGPLTAVSGKLLYLRYPAAGAFTPGGPSPGTLLSYNLAEREESEIISGIDTYTISADGKKLIYKSGAVYGIIDIVPGKKPGDGSIPVGGMTAWIDPREEWKQIYTEAWRIQRDYFYDPNMHELDWEKIGRRYEALLQYAVDREDVNYIIGELFGELNSSHAYVFGGDMERAGSMNVGLLGCDFDLDKRYGKFRIAKIYEGAPWDAEVRSPLAQPGVEVNEGDYLLAVNGIAPDVSVDPWAAFQGLLNQVVELTVGAEPSLEGAKKILITPLSSEARLRNLAWIDENRRKVEAATGGKAGYIYVPNTGIDGQNELVRQFIPQINKAGLIIDERFNSGGQIPDRFIELMNRPMYSFFARREFRDLPVPYVSHVGPKVMIINEWAGSGGDAFPLYFRKAGLGPLVGKRTWGGLIGISGNPSLIDGGVVYAPNISHWDPKGYWSVEGHGVDPDYEIQNLPNELASGKDAQLDKAIEVVLHQLDVNPPPKFTRPPYPDRRGIIK